MADAACPYCGSETVEISFRLSGGGDTDGSSLEITCKQCHRKLDANQFRSSGENKAGASDSAASSSSSQSAPSMSSGGGTAAAMAEESMSDSVEKSIARHKKKEARAKAGSIEPQQESASESEKKSSSAPMETMGSRGRERLARIEEDLALSAEGSSAVLLEAARPELYRANAFRVTGLAVDAAPRDISRHNEKLKMMEKLGSAAAAAGPLALAPAPDAHSVRDAMQRLNDPERRLIDELFWFWPAQPNQSRTDEALTALARGDHQTAAQIWSNRLSDSEHGASSHNLAVLAHASALDLEYKSRSNALTEAEKNELHRNWLEAFKHWRALSEQEGFWSRVSNRIREIDDPRLTTGASRRMKSSLPLALLSINAQLAVAAAERGDASEAKRHVSLMRESGFSNRAVDEASFIDLVEPQAARRFSDRMVDEALRRAVEPIRERIFTVCRAAQPEADDDPTRADQVAKRLLEQTEPMLAVIDRLLPAGNPVRDGAHDEVALRLLMCLVAFGNKTERWKEGLRELEKAYNIAASESARTRINENLTTARTNVESGSDWCDEGYYDLPKPTLDRLEEARSHALARDWDAAIPILADVWKGATDPAPDKQSKKLAQKPLAFCLNMKSVASLNAAMDEFNRPLSTLLALQLMSSFGRRSNSAYSYMSGVGLTCEMCGGSIYQQYMNFTYQGNSYTMCMGCGGKVNKEQNDRKRELRRHMKGAGQYMVLARWLDPSNKTMENNIAEIKKAGTEIGAKVPTKLFMRMSLAIVTFFRMLGKLKSKGFSFRKARGAAWHNIAGVFKWERRARIMLKLVVTLMILWSGTMVAVVIAHNNGDPSATYTLYSYGFIGKDKAISTLTAALTNESTEKAGKAADALSKIDPNWVNSDGAMQALPALVADLKNLNENVRRSAQMSLSRISGNWWQSKWVKDAIPSFTAALADKNPLVRLAAVDGLSRMGPGAKEAAPALASALKDADYNVRKKAAEALVAIGPNASEALPALLAALDEKPSQRPPADRAKQTEFLNKVMEAITKAGLRSKDAILRLVAVKSDRNEISGAANNALITIAPGAKDAVAPLMALLKNPSQAVRESAIFALGKIGPEAKDAIPTLTAAQKDRDFGIRNAAMQALREIQTPARR